MPDKPKPEQKRNLRPKQSLKHKPKEYQSNEEAGKYQD
jgi:hypothetical protein